MRQAVLTAPEQIEFREVPNPTATQLNENEILIHIKKIGICGSEIHSYHGEHPATFYPVVQGHEYSGIVTATGAKVTKCKPGDKVTARSAACLRPMRPLPPRAIQRLRKPPSTGIPSRRGRTGLFHRTGRPARQTAGDLLARIRSDDRAGRRRGACHFACRRPYGQERGRVGSRHDR